MRTHGIGSSQDENPIVTVLMGGTGRILYLKEDVPAIFLYFCPSVVAFFPTEADQKPWGGGIGGAVRSAIEHWCCQFCHHSIDPMGPLAHQIDKALQTPL